MRLYLQVGDNLESPQKVIEDMLRPGGHATLHPGVGSCFGLRQGMTASAKVVAWCWSSDAVAQSAFGGKYFIHWTADPETEEFFKFDVVDRDQYNEAPGLFA